MRKLDNEQNWGLTQTETPSSLQHLISEEEELQTEISNQTSRLDLTDSLNSLGLEYHRTLNREGKRKFEQEEFEVDISN
ncbi:uncharacterized protein [Scyliorhinus torazame]|uniref:uncharacterized protein isoform X2 n=1 Tax=Scyliorhinus torazame TaxID=75743 RepID=UPI003B58D79F